MTSLSHLTTDYTFTVLKGFYICPSVSNSNGLMNCDSALEGRQQCLGCHIGALAQYVPVGVSLSLMSDFADKYTTFHTYQL